MCVSVYTLRWGYLKVWIKHLTKLLHSCSPRTYTNTLGCLSYFCTLTIWSHSWLHHTPTTVFSSMLSLCSTKHTLRITCSRCTTAHFIHSFHFMMGQRRIRLLEHLFLFQPIHSLSFMNTKYPNFDNYWSWSQVLQLYDKKILICDDRTRPYNAVLLQFCVLRHKLNWKFDMMKCKMKIQNSLSGNQRQLTEI